VQVMINGYMFLTKADFDIEYLGYCLLLKFFLFEILECCFFQDILLAQEIMEHFQL